MIFRFSYIFSPKQCLRPLGYCALPPLKLNRYVSWKDLYKSNFSHATEKPKFSFKSSTQLFFQLGFKSEALVHRFFSIVINWAWNSTLWSIKPAFSVNWNLNRSPGCVFFCFQNSDFASKPTLCSRSFSKSNLLLLTSVVICYLSWRRLRRFEAKKFIFCLNSIRVE